jgi:hypothetical protein
MRTLKASARKYRGDELTMTPKEPSSMGEIRKRAYDLYTQRGGAHRMHLDDWLKAEEQLRQQLSD